MRGKSMLRTEGEALFAERYMAQRQKHGDTLWRISLTRVKECPINEDRRQELKAVQNWGCNDRAEISNVRKIEAVDAHKLVELSWSVDLVVV